MKKDDIVDIIAGYRESLMTMDRKIDFANQDSIYSIQLIGEIAALLEIYDSIINQEYEDAINLAKKYDEYIHNSDNRREFLQFKIIAYENLGKYQEALTVIDDLEIEVEFEYELYTASTYELIKQNLLEQLGQASLNKPHFLKDSTPLLTELNNIPTDFSLGNIYPNPFNPVTQLPLGLPEDSQVKIDV